MLSSDDGEVEFSIPPFDPLEPLSKYGFSSMALVYVPVVFSKENAKGSPRSGRILPTRITVTLYVSQNAGSVFYFQLF